MAVPSSTYRLQFRDGMTFDRAGRLAGQLKSMGISHVYASPIFTATRGSTHGYDVTDANEIDPAIGGRAGFERFAAALRAAGLGLILDIVPNHMAASTENEWWLSVLEWGADSPQAKHFDIDWRERLTLPCLGGTLDEVLESGELKLGVAPDGAYLAADYFDDHFPLDPRTYAAVLSRLDDARAARIGELAAAASPASAASFHRGMRALLSQPVARSRLHEALMALAVDAPFMHDVLARQPWQLISWRDAGRHLSYRRFFEIAGLVGVRVESDVVFDDTHRLILELVSSGLVDGLRIDHIDGLADPGAYLRRLRQKAGPATFIIVEKILCGAETLPPEWPVAGTTGYEFIAALADLLVARHGSDKLEEAYRAVAGEAADYGAGARRAKARMVDYHFAGETSTLVDIAKQIAASEGQAGPDNEAVRIAIRELLIGFPVYRTYGIDGAADARDRKTLDTATRYAERLADKEAIAIVGRALSGAIATPAARRFRTRFQQLSGPIMAKAIEDTLFYRYNRLLAANEVGGEPDRPPGGIERFQRLMAQRLREQPNGLSATSTHDTKRGEDARARLFALSEAPDVWASGVERWRSMHRHHVRVLPDGPAPEPNMEWMIYQALAGIWPDSIDAFDTTARKQLEGRFLAYLEKAMREAKLRTDWLEPVDGYEAAVKDYARNLLSTTSSVFIADFSRTLEPFVRTGFLNSLTQTLVKMTAPGIPDIYQGAEGLDFSLVDPDNRRPVAYEHFAAMLEEDDTTPWARREPEAMKLGLVQHCLRLRRARAGLFSGGSYVPLDVSGARREHVVAFARQSSEDFALTIAPRLMHGRLMPGKLHAPPDFWADTAVMLPAALQHCVMRQAFTGATFETAAALALSPLLGVQPVVLLLPEG